jgi:energy-coupling factor transporter ATP-binding protein EcfA2
MTIGDDIGRWAATRPVWQQEILQTLADGLPITEAELAAAIASLLDPPSTGPAKPLNLAIASSDDVTVTLTALRGCKGVNALAEGQELDFATGGLTVIYGDNGSGKSGYARLIKKVVGARHPAQILPDVFLERASDPCALIQYAADLDPREHKVPGPADPLIRQMHFYDEHCGDAYLARKSVISYRPSALVLMDGLIEVCDRLRNALADRLRENHLRALELDLPSGTVAAAFAASMTADTSEATVESATTPDPEATQKMAAAVSEVARLEASSASAERARLTGLAQASEALSSLLAAAGGELGVGSLNRANGAMIRTCGWLSAR